MSRQAGLGFLLGLGVSLGVGGLSACICGNVGHDPPAMVPSGEFEVPASEFWRGEFPTDLRLRFDGDRLLVIYTLIELGVSTGIRIEVEYEVEETEIR